MSRARPVPSGAAGETARFRRGLFAAFLAVLVLATSTTLWIARERIARDEEQALEREFDTAFTALGRLQELRHGAILERCRGLAGRARIHAAIEDGALDLLYPSARDELRDVLAPLEPDQTDVASAAWGGRFYRFLDQRGRVIAPASGDLACGPLGPLEEQQLALHALPRHPASGYISTGRTVHEVFVTPILSTETGEPIAALAIGFDPIQLSAGNAQDGFASGLLLGTTIHLPAVSDAGRAAVLRAIQNKPGAPGEVPVRIRATIDGEPYLLIVEALNPHSPYPLAKEIGLYPLRAMHDRQLRATWQIGGTGAGLVALGLVASRLLARRFTQPVERLALDSAEQRTRREHAEAELQATSAELERAARFSADASHQLKTPVTVLRAGLEGMLARDALPPAEAEEVSALIHQTFRLSSVIDVLLLLSRMDARQLKIRFSPVDLRHLIEASLDDLGAIPDGLELEIEADLTGELVVSGEKGYIALILQNLLENARKYNRPGGRIAVAARAGNECVTVTIGNTTLRPIPLHAREHIFERFHRGSAGEDVPGYGIGLNLARQLARLHDGDLRLVRSDEWTEFELRFRSAVPGPAVTK